MINVAFQGTYGAYGHEALKRYFKEQANPIGLELSEHVFEALLAG
jgi:prephenate dehydratase